MYIHLRFPKTKSSLCAVAFALGLAVSVSAGSAATVNISTDDSSPVETAAIATYATTGATMDGMLITGGFLGAPSKTLVFGATGAESGATGPGSFAVSQAGDSFFSAFTVTVTGARTLTSLVFDGAPGNTVFDIDGSSFLSKDSFLGKAFLELTGLSGVIDVAFSNPVAVTPDAPAGDLYGTMAITFDGLVGGGLTEDQRLVFLQDTDTTLNHMDTEVTVMPLPASGWTLLLGLTGLGLLGRYRMKRRAG